ncbi:hypothetical protein FYJ79_11710 [Sharpea azabuensis]|uniref:Helicase n=1 Tax=Sharpea porci TaxID=2652286 RepID=A0A844FYC8_9FIRM|nr:helicase-related protein [Sharpea porci]MST90220.1 hypothetical protein [Sharpea porci]
MGLLDIGIRGSYIGKGENILNEFLLPSLCVAKKYDRIAGFFSIESLLAIANGIESLHRNKGTMRLIVGVHSIPKELIDASIKRKELKNDIQKVQEEIEKEISSLSDLLDKTKVATLAWMIDEGLLTVKAATVLGEGIFHPKTIIIKDNDDNEVAAVGSPNESRNGLGSNFEQLMVATSWNNLDAVNDQKVFFDTLWNNQCNDVIVLDITKETAAMIKKSLGSEYKSLKNLITTSIDNVLASIAEMPLNFFVSGNIPSLYMHQERAVIDALSRWPVRVLFSDEVGLGKTFEAAATISFLNKYCNVNRIIILTPKSVLRQWQEELSENFNIDTWLFDSNKKEYISSNNQIILMGNNNPLGYGSPNLILMSSQYARGNKNNNGLLAEESTILPDLLVVDEAHSARISEDLSGKPKKTQMYKMLEKIKGKIPHIILATATPMQKNAKEYHAMLNLLGLPKIWQKEQSFLNSLRFIMQDSIEDLSDANKIVSLLHYTNQEMRPDLSLLTDVEKSLLTELEDLYAQNNHFENAMFVKNEWNTLKNIFIKLHPARMLTIRNTRRSLSEIGYKFPKRNLREISLYESDKIKLLYANVYSYLNKECFSVERELHPDKKFNISFIKISYQQRVASSLYSCKISLERRMNKIEALKNYFEFNQFVNNIEYGNDIDDFDDFDQDDLLDQDSNSFDKLIDSNIDINNLKRAINIECCCLESLITQINTVLNNEGDQKIEKSIEKSLEVLKNGDSVLLFTRYTDTVDALIKHFNLKNKKFSYPYAIYTGNKSTIVSGEIYKECDKTEIKEALFSKKIRIVFCSDAASEGINLQAARILINVDVPWTPARLEQRIGRIARLGQVADEVDIYNVWYPNSVEAKMYSRIQKRLIGANIAIGEFPDVVAENIKHAILQNEKDDSLEMLKNIRNDMQKDALDKLWSDKNDKSTYSDEIRKKLLELVKKEFDLVNYDKENGIYKFNVGGKVYETTILCGNKNSISLKSKEVSNINKKFYGFNVVKNAGIDICLQDKNTKKIIKTESVIDVLINSSYENITYYDNYPTMLPNPKKLNLEFSLENKCTNSPLLWVKYDEFNKRK